MADRVHSAAIHLLRRARRADAGSGVSSPQLSALSVIVYAGPLTVGELAAAERVRPPTISRLVKRLEADGLVEREVAAADRRVVLVRATDAGVRLLEEGRVRRITALAKQLQKLPKEELDRLSEAAETLERVLAEEW